MDGVCSVASCVGRELAPHVKKHGGKLIPESMKKDKDGRSNIDGAMVVAASGVQGKVNFHFIFFKTFFLFFFGFVCFLLKTIFFICLYFYIYTDVFEKTFWSFVTWPEI